MKKRAIRGLSRSKKKGPVRSGVVKRGLQGTLRFFIKILVCFLLTTLVGTLILKWINPPVTASFLWRNIRNRIQKQAGAPMVHHWISFKDISPPLFRAVLAGEDQRFWSHHGFDFIEMNLALRDMATGGRFRGASTITMQTARTVFLWKGRSVVRKILEAYFTVALELIWGKKRILEVYVNWVDWGPNIIGIEAASRAYFKTRANRLNQKQSAMLAAILPNPHKWSPTRPTPYILKRQQRILKEMNQMQLSP